jgi:hypothetical protein
MKVRISWPGESDVELLVKNMATMSGLDSNGVQSIRSGGKQFICFVRDFCGLESAFRHIDSMQQTIHRLLGRYGEVMTQENAGDEFQKVA